MGQSRLTRYVDRSGDTHRRIDHEPSRSRASPSGAQLEHVVNDDDRLTEIDQDVVNGLANEPGSEGAIEGSNDSQASPRKGHLDGEASAVSMFERIVRRRRRGRMAGVGDTDEHHRYSSNQP